MFLLFAALGLCNGPTPTEKVLPATNYSDQSIFGKISDVWFMTMMIAFLMMFIKKYEWGVLAATILSAASSFVMYVFLKNVCFGHEFNALLQAEGVICAITCTIGIGVFVGTIKYFQYIIVGICFAASYYLIEYLVVSGDVLVGMVDPGGAIPVHMFAAYWGLGVAIMLREKRVCGYEPVFTTHSMNWVWLASTLLWILWPSFVTMFWSGSMASKGSYTCVMSGLGSILSSFFAESICKKGKVDPLVYAYALLGGCVGISSALFIVGPWGGLLIGLISGVVSVLSFNYLHPYLTRLLGINDIMGVHNLHGVCSWVSVIAGMISCYAVGFPGGWTLLAALICFVIAISTGIILGLILKYTKFGELPESSLMNDKVDFVFPAVEENEHKNKNDIVGL